jgi:hypothetical protein
MDKQQLLDQLYEVLYQTENEEVFSVIGDAIDFVKVEL